MSTKVKILCGVGAAGVMALLYYFGTRKDPKSKGARADAIPVDPNDPSAGSLE